jgi:hypothetical protein
MQIGKPSFTLCFYFGHIKIRGVGRSFVHKYGLTEWSDGAKFEELPSLEKTKLQRCELCIQFYWSSQRFGGLCFEDHVEAVDYFEKKFSRNNIVNYINKLKNKKRLIYIRTKILQQYNDQIRIHPLSNGDLTKKTIPVEIKKIFVDNAKILIDLLTKTNSDNFFLLAELHRNIGNFEDSKRILNQLPNCRKKELLLKEIELENCDVIKVIQPLLKEQKNLKSI